MTSLLVWFAVAAAVDAPITEVTVYSDGARIVRTAAISTGGAQVVELPVLPQSVDLASIRVESTGAEVKRVELVRLEDDALPPGEAKKLVTALQGVDDALAKMNGELQALARQIASLNRIAPVAPSLDPLKAPPKLNAAGWTSAMTFVADALAKSQTRQRELAVKQQALTVQREVLAAKAAAIGATQTRFGWKVLAHLAGPSPSLRLVYFVSNARWFPLYDLTLNPDTSKVTIAFSGQVSQESGEDWADAALTLSTAIPSTATTLPKLLTWKIGERERFIPTPSPMLNTVKPPPSVPPLPGPAAENALLRNRLAQAAAPNGEPMPPEAPMALLDNRADRDVSNQKQRPKQNAPRAEMERSVQVSSDSPAPSGGFFSSREESAPYQPTFGFSLAPPPGYPVPRYGAELPAGAAGGYELAYPSVQRETVPSGKGARKVALFSEAWPVKVERKLFPALFPEAFLVAELKNPSTRPLPGGAANLFVGDDPAGVARLKLVAPGEAFTLPLGIDRALKPVRNVKVVQSETGLINKDEVTRYDVTLELANPYRQPVSIRLIDQQPVAKQKEVEVKLLETKPEAIADKRTGALEWRLTVPAGQKTVVTFAYTVKRPKGWLMQQVEVAP